MKRFAVGLALTLHASSALAFTVSVTDTSHVIKWYNNNLKFELQVDADGPAKKAPGTTLDDVNAAINRSISSWNNASCTDVVLTISGVTTETANVVSETETVENLDYINRVVWIENDKDYPFGKLVLGVTSAIFYLDGTVVEADVALNGADNTWEVYEPGSTTTSEGPVDVESVVVHELGHLLGLAHVLKGGSTTDPPTMAPVVDPRLRTRDPSADDINGLCFLYPQTKYTCDNDADCPKFIVSNGDSDGGNESYASLTSECASSSCTNIETVPCGSGNLGERCCTDNCTGSLFCLDVAQGHSDMAYCASSCSTSSKNCPDGFTCVGLSTGGTNGACISDAVTNCSCDTNNSCTSSCACDTDCGSGGSANVGSNDGGCSQIGGIWAALACMALMTRRVRLL